MGVQGLPADRYELQELLGRGAMGEVWRACDQLLGRPVAVRLLHAEDTADAERFRLEAQIAARLGHPNVVGMYDFGSHHDQPHLVMELVDGWNPAQERSVRGVLAPAEAAVVTAQAAAGLGHRTRQRGADHRPHGEDHRLRHRVLRRGCRQQPDRHGKDHRHCRLPDSGTCVGPPRAARIPRLLPRLCPVAVPA